MNHTITQDTTVCVVGLGYVGYPLADAFSRHLKTIGYDVDKNKIARIAAQPNNQILVCSEPSMIHEADVIIMAVPTPVTKSKDPDISFIISAAETVGHHMKNGAIVVLESTVYPGLTEEILIPTLEKASSKICGQDFFVGYSPERINPGDQEHALENITKIVAGMNEETVDKLAMLYGLVTNVFIAKDIRTAEAAKVIENVQRDINIALVNELSIIFRKMELDTKAVLEAAGTKWNFHNYRPGLVGGHCIPVDPYYLVYKAEEVGHHPRVILAGRAINDSMPKEVAQIAIKELNRADKIIQHSNVLILGLTYKENVADTRESPARELIHELHEFNINVYGHDPYLEPSETEGFGAINVASLGEIDSFMDCIIINSPHSVFNSLTPEDILRICNENPIVIDVTGLLAKDHKVKDVCRYFTL